MSKMRSQELGPTAIILAPDSTWWQPSMKEETLWLPIFLLLPFYRQEGKEKQEGNVDFGFVKYLKNA